MKETDNNDAGEYDRIARTRREDNQRKAGCAVVVCCIAISAMLVMMGIVKLIKMIF